MYDTLATRSTNWYKAECDTMLPRRKWYYKVCTRMRTVKTPLRTHHLWCNPSCAVKDARCTIQGDLCINSDTYIETVHDCVGLFVYRKRNSVLRRWILCARLNFVTQNCCFLWTFWLKLHKCTRMYKHIFTLTPVLYFWQSLWCSPMPHKNILLQIVTVSVFCKLENCVLVTNTKTKNEAHTEFL